MTEEVKKLYYGISEVSVLTGIKQYVLRYWESEFDILRPLKNRSGNRAYTEDDIVNILTIKRLLHEEKYTIEGAKRKLNLQHQVKPSETLDLVREVREELEAALRQLR